MNDWNEKNLQRDESGYHMQQGWNMQRTQLRRCFSRMGLFSAAFLVVSTVSQLIVVLLLREQRAAMGENLWMLIIMLSMYPVTILVCYMMVRKIPKAVQVWKQPMGLGLSVKVLVISMGAVYAGNLIGQLLMRCVSLITGEPVVNDMQEMIMGMDMWTLLIVAVIIGPVVEELVFRKFLLDRIAGYGQITAMLVSGLIFGLAHGNFYQFFYAFALGMIFAWVYLRTGNIMHTIGLHMFINYCGSIMPMTLLKVAERNVVLGAFLAMGQMMFMFASMIMAVILLVYHRGEIIAREDRRWIPKGKWAAAVFLNFGMIVFYVVAGAMFFL